MNAGKHHDAVVIFTDGINRFSPKAWHQLPEFYINFGLALGKIGRM